MGSTLPAACYWPLGLVIKSVSRSPPVTARPRSGFCTQRTSGEWGAGDQPGAGADLWAAVVAERLGHPADTALTLGRAVAGSAARVKARNIGREEHKADRDADRPGLRPDHVTAPAVLLGKTIRLLPTTGGELRAADGEQPADPAAIQRYLAKAFGDHLDEVRQAMDELASRYESAELNRIGFRLYEKFRPDVPLATKGGANGRSWTWRRSGQRHKHRRDAVLRRLWRSRRSGLDKLVVASEHKWPTARGPDSCSDRPHDDWLKRMKIGPYRDDGTAQRSIFEVLPNS
jgi:hypothetical protein